MFEDLRFTLLAIKKNVQSSAELRTSFLMNILGMVINNTSFIVLWMFFVKSIGDVGGWQPVDIIALQGFTAIAYGITFSVGYGIRKLPDYVSSGAFDRFMLSPKNLLLRIATSSFSASAIGDMIFGILCLVIYGFLIHAGIYKIILLLALLLLSTIVFAATCVAIFSASFLFVDADASANGMFEFFLTPALFDGGAFQGVMRFVFTFIVPSLVIGALPVEVLKDLSLGKLLLIFILAITWVFISTKIFYKAVEKYESTNFITFGN